MKPIFTLICASIFLLSCKTKKLAEYSPNQKIAEDLSQEFIIMDGHVDLPYRLKVTNFRLERDYVGIPIESEKGDFDYKRAKEGGLDGPFMSIYIPSSKDQKQAKLLADTLINMVRWIAEENNSFFHLANSPSDVELAKSNGKIALPMGMENGSPISKLQDAAYFRSRGISYVTLTHAKDNHICDSSYDTTATWHGLSPFGYLLVPELSKQGIMIDVSHISDNAFYDVLEVAPVPLMASHSSARKFVPGFERNMSDDIIAKMGENGGVIMINFGSTFIDGEVSEHRQMQRESLKKLLDEKGVTAESEEGKVIVEEFKKNNPSVYADVKRVADHIDHVVEVAGIDHVGFGSDYDGVGDSLPTGLKDVSDYPNLIAELLDRGYTKDEIEKICYKNLFRVWQATIDYSNSFP